MSKADWNVDGLLSELRLFRERVGALLKNVGEPGNCEGCKEAIYWLVHRNGKHAPYNFDGSNHFITCPMADKFRRAKEHGTTADTDR